MNIIKNQISIPIRSTYMYDAKLIMHANNFLLQFSNSQGFHRTTYVAIRIENTTIFLFDLIGVT